MSEHCEYGCGGACENLDHWRDRTAYWKQVADNQLERAEAAEAESAQIVEGEYTGPVIYGSEARKAAAAEAERDEARAALQWALDLTRRLELVCRAALEGDKDE